MDGAGNAANTEEQDSATAFVLVAMVSYGNDSHSGSGGPGLHCAPVGLDVGRQEGANSCYATRSQFDHIGGLSTGAPTRAKDCREE